LCLSYEPPELSVILKVFLPNPTGSVGFSPDQQNLPTFAQVSIGNLKLILRGPRASGSRPMPDGRQREPCGWNRIVLLVQDLPARIAHLKNQGVHFRNEMEVGPGGNSSDRRS
jgi:glyoxylase I family protein